MNEVPNEQLNEAPKVLIIGAGPAGLVAAHALARRGTLDITVAERDPDPFRAPKTTDRSYTIDITGHGLRAVRYLDCVEAFDRELIRFRGIRVHAPYEQDLPWEERGWTGSRGDILQTLLAELEDRYPGRVNFRWQTEVRSLDVLKGEAQLGEEREHFDLILGCDGAGALTRRAMSVLPGFTTEGRDLPNYCTMVELDQNTEALDPEWLHMLNGHPFTVAGAVNGRDKNDPKWFCMVGFNHQHRFGSGCCAKGLEPVEEACRYFEKHTEILSCISDAELERFVERECHHIGKAVACSSLHGGKAVMLGDAASAFPPVGQGINAAMESAVVFDQALETVGESATAEQLLAAAELYNERWKPEADAALWIATRWTFSNIRMSAKMALAEFLDCNVISQAKSMDYSEVYTQAQKRLKRLGPLRKLMEP